jgi:cardiolipin synthase
MKEAIMNARRSIDIEQFIIEPDEAGREFFHLLAKQAQHGVSIRILADMVGSSKLFFSPIVEELKSQGISVRFWNPVKPWRLHKAFTWFRRDHRKIMVVDGTIGFVGGVGIRKDFRDWRDAHVSVRGPVVESLQAAFDRQWSRTESKRARQFLSGEHAGYALLLNEPLPGRRKAYRALVAAIRGADKTVKIITPYFVPPLPLERSLIQARRRGVRVAVMIPQASNHPWVDRAAWGIYKRMTTAGVEIRAFMGPMHHAKVAVIDSEVAMIGSMNMDSLSTRWNYEIMLLSSDKSLVENLEESFDNDLASCRPLDSASLKTGTVLEGVLRFFARFARPFL